MRACSAIISRWKTHLDLDVEILKIKRVFPDIDTDDGDVRQERVLVGRRHDLECLALGVVALHRSHDDNNEGSLALSDKATNRGRKTYEPAPTGTLDGCRGRIELLLENVERAKGGVDGCPQGSVLEHATVTLARNCRGRQVRPEEGVVDVA